MHPAAIVVISLLQRQEESSFWLNEVAALAEATIRSNFSRDSSEVSLLPALFVRSSPSRSASPSRTFVIFMAMASFAAHRSTIAPDPRNVVARSRSMHRPADPRRRRRAACIYRNLAYREQLIEVGACFGYHRGAYPK